MLYSVKVLGMALPLAGPDLLVKVRRHGRRECCPKCSAMLHGRSLMSLRRDSALNLGHAGWALAAPTGSGTRKHSPSRKPTRRTGMRAEHDRVDYSADETLRRLSDAQ